MDTKDVLKTGTTTVGIKCKDGIVLAADKRATAGNLIADKKTKKVYVINHKMAMTVAGSVSDIQLLAKLIKAELKLKDYRVGRNSNVKEAANLLSGMVYGNIRKMSMMPGISHFLFAGYDKSGFSIYDIFPDGSLTEIDNFVASGSGSVFAYGVLETLYHDDITVEEATKLAVKSINAALQRDTGSGNGIDVARITENEAVEITTQELNNRLQ
jgi:proteasome beta subunit